MSYEARTLQEVVLGECPIASLNVPYPSTLQGLCGRISGYCPDLGVGGGGPPLPPDSYFEAMWSPLLKYCLFDITIYNTMTSEVVGKHFKKKFLTCASLNNFINDEVLHADLGGGEVFTQDCLIKIYNLEDGTIPSINRIGCYNKFYNCLVGGSKSYGAPSLYQAVDPGRAEDNFNNSRAFFNFGRLWAGQDLSHAAFETFVKTAWQQVWGITPGADGYPDYNDSDITRRAWLSTIWFQLNTKRGSLYRLPAADEGLKIFCGTNGIDPPVPNIWRGVVDGTSIGDAVIAVQNEQFVIEKFAVCTIPLGPAIAPDMGGNWNNNAGFSWYNSANVQWAWDNSGIIIYGVRSGNRKALYIKPFGGPDSFCMPKYDITQYRLEMLVSNNYQRDKVQVINIADPGQISVDRGGHKLYSFVVRKPGFGSWTTKNNNFTRGSIDCKFRFYLRKIDSEYVSPISPVFIHVKFNDFGKRMAAVSYKVESDH